MEMRVKRSTFTVVAVILTEYKFEDHLAVLAGAKERLATASGMAAISHAIFGLVKAGDHIVSDWTTYSSNHEWFDHRITDTEYPFFATGGIGGVHTGDWDVPQDLFELTRTSIVVVSAGPKAILDLTQDILRC